MFNLRGETRDITQRKYGHYCSHTRRNGKIPISYLIFADYIEKGLTVKEIYKKENG